jgi:hypothetical protein
MSMSKVLKAPRQVVCVFSVEAATEEVVKAWIRELENGDGAERACLVSANCGVVQQRQFMRILVGRVLSGVALTQQDADYINGIMGSPFIPTTLPSLTKVLRDVLREDVHIGPRSVEIVESAYCSLKSSIG